MLHSRDPIGQWKGPGESEERHSQGSQGARDAGKNHGPTEIAGAALGDRRGEKAGSRGAFYIFLRNVSGGISLRIALWLGSQQNKKAPHHENHRRIETTSLDFADRRVSHGFSKRDCAGLESG